MPSWSAPNEVIGHGWRPCLATNRGLASTGTPVIHRVSRRRANHSTIGRVKDPIALQRLAAGQNGLVTAQQCVVAGYSPDEIKKHVRSKFWERITRGVYLLDADLRPERPRHLLARAALLAAGEEAALVLHDAAELHGLSGLRDDKRIHLSLPGNGAVPRRLGDRDVIPHQFVLSPGDYTIIRGLRTTTIERTLADLVLNVDRDSAVSVLDNALFRGVLRQDDLPTVEGLMSRRRGAVLRRPWLGLADGRAESPLESRGRLRCVDAKMPPDELQAEIRRPNGSLAARVDMLWRGAGLVAEADGAEFHDRPDALFRDRERQNELIAMGFKVVRFTWQDTVDVNRLPNMLRRFF